MVLAALRIIPRPRDGRAGDRHGLRAGVAPPGADGGLLPGEVSRPHRRDGTTLTPGRLTPDGGAFGAGPVGSFGGFGRLGSIGSGIRIWDHRRNLVIGRARGRAWHRLERNPPGWCRAHHTNLPRGCARRQDVNGLGPGRTVRSSRRA